MTKMIIGSFYAHIVEYISPAETRNFCDICVCVCLSHTFRSLSIGRNPLGEL